MLKEAMLTVSSGASKAGKTKQKKKKNNLPGRDLFIFTHHRFRFALKNYLIIYHKHLQPVILKLRFFVKKLRSNIHGMPGNNQQPRRTRPGHVVPIRQPHLEV
jgi:hypothetical protein